MPQTDLPILKVSKPADILRKIKLRQPLPRTIELEGVQYVATNSEAPYMDRELLTGVRDCHRPALMLFYYPKDPNRIDYFILTWRWQGSILAPAQVLKLSGDGSQQIWDQEQFSMLFARIYVAIGVSLFLAISIFGWLTTYILWHGSQTKLLVPAYIISAVATLLSLAGLLIKAKLDLAYKSLEAQIHS